MIKGLELSFDNKPLIYGCISIFLISMSSLSGVLTLPLLRMTSGHKWMHFFLAMAVATLSGDAFMHLIPMVLGLHSHMATNGHGPTQNTVLSNSEVPPKIELDKIERAYLSDQIPVQFKLRQGRSIPFIDLKTNFPDHSEERGKLKRDTEMSLLAEMGQNSQTYLSNFEELDLLQLLQGFKGQKKDRTESTEKGVVDETTEGMKRILPKNLHQRVQIDTNTEDEKEHSHENKEGRNYSQNKGDSSERTLLQEHRPEDSNEDDHSHERENGHSDEFGHDHSRGQSHEHDQQTYDKAQELYDESMKSDNYQEYESSDYNSSKNSSGDSRGHSHSDGYSLEHGHLHSPEDIKEMRKNLLYMLIILTTFSLFHIFEYTGNNALRHKKNVFL